MERVAAELFAGVGGFRLGLQEAGWEVSWSNQWEPATKRQHASETYVRHFGNDGHTTADIVEVVRGFRARRSTMPRFDMLVGGFPCQDYSVARPVRKAAGLAGSKGELWWALRDFIELSRPQVIFLENVDRLLKSPAGNRGQDFAAILYSLAHLGYAVEWRVINAADYGEAQRRRRVFIVGYPARPAPTFSQARDLLLSGSVLSEAFPHGPLDAFRCFDLVENVAGGLDFQGCPLKPRGGPFLEGGVMFAGRVWTFATKPIWSESARVLRDVLEDHDTVDSQYFVPEEQLDQWRYVKGAKREARVSTSGNRYDYIEGAVPFPDAVDQPARTILTGEGGAWPSRLKHVIETPDGRFRRLTPVELERLNGFPDGWTASLHPTRRAFLMGNALVVPLVTRVAEVLTARFAAQEPLSKLSETGLSSLVSA